MLKILTFIKLIKKIIKKIINKNKVTITMFD